MIKKIFTIIISLTVLTLLIGCLKNNKQETLHDLMWLKLKNPKCTPNIIWCQEQLTNDILKSSFVKNFISTAKSHELLTHKKGQYLTILGMNINKYSFICCDIQARFQRFKIEKNQELSIAKFYLPKDVAIELNILGEKKFHERIYDKKIDLINLYFNGKNTNKKQIKNKIQEIHINNFSRKVSIYRTQLNRKLDYIIYMQDGANLYYHVKLLEEYWIFNSLKIPNIAIIAIESADSSKRNREYVKGFRDGEKDYQNYKNIFRTEIVPSVENYLQYEGGKEGRILYGVSNGAAWSLGYFLEQPNFSCQVIALSYVGPPIKNYIVPTVKSSPSLSKCRKIYLAAGIFENNTLKRTQRAAQNLKNLQYSVEMKVINSGHSPLLWSTNFVKYLEQSLISTK